MGHDSRAEWEIGMYGEKDGEIDVWCIAEG